MTKRPKSLERGSVVNHKGNTLIAKKCNFLDAFNNNTALNQGDLARTYRLARSTASRLVINYTAFRHDKFNHVDARDKVARKKSGGHNHAFTTTQEAELVAKSPIDAGRE